LKHENSNLEKKHPEFRYLMNEFHDGILLFEISGRKVWNKVQDDSIGLMKYYEENKYKSLTKPGISVSVYKLKKHDGMKSLRNAYKKYSRYPDADKRLIEKFISRRDTLLTIKKGIWYKGENKEIDNFKWIKGIQETTLNGFPALIVIDKIIDAEPLPFSSVQGEMISGYQEYLENNWVRQLKEKYTVKVENVVMEEIRKKLDNE
jgi:peptidyl-prolyl cis-trans isomerase SurA